MQSLKLNGATVTADQLPSAFRTRVQGIQVPVDGLPKGLALSDAVVASDGLRITADGTDVEVPQTTPGRRAPLAPADLGTAHRLARRAT